MISVFVIDLIRKQVYCLQMNFDSMEDTIYGGNVEQDEDLLAELMALQNEVRSTQIEQPRIGIE